MVLMMMMMIKFVPSFPYNDCKAHLSFRVGSCMRYSFDVSSRCTISVWPLGFCPTRNTQHKRIKIHNVERYFRAFRVLKLYKMVHLLVTTNATTIRYIGLCKCLAVVRYSANVSLVERLLVRLLKAIPIGTETRIR